MRYLKVIAQDRFGSGRPDTVLLHFCEVGADNKDIVVNRAVALDLIEDGCTDFHLGDVTQDGVESDADHTLLYQFAGAYLKLNWFNSGLASSRYLQVYTEDFYKDGTPDTVRLHVHEGEGTPCDKTQVMWNAAYDFDNDGALEWNIHFDINHDGVINDVDQGLVQELADTFLKFNWHAPSITTP
ncbi:hypothetical protein [Pseudomonas sp. 22 E 5]|uniref:Uncharacterized protein n=1 Tax=Pseudomonas salomonii TaxID=191391 RepID=A0A1H3QP94_9PSED|nr:MULTISPECIES: hypothetical protein [Pseudomonas]NWF11264.1 hypothetical protein [Pseudomonas salomonii]CRM19591.1 hypothetical protein [Pseudomonas sp. 58 R 3]CRM83243.1 hypothetical protein [Pseudomonas sp. 22 E 5]SDZ14838.1 hypothetical protein SAMN05216247_107236 [Pseudomonas salomonii]